MALFGICLCLFALLVTFACASSDFQGEDPHENDGDLFENHGHDHDVPTPVDHDLPSPVDHGPPSPIDHEHDRGHDLFDHSTPSIADFLHKHKIYMHKPLLSPVERPKLHPTPVEKPKCPILDDKPKEKPEPKPEPEAKPKPSYHFHPFFKKPFYKPPKTPISG